MYSMGPTVEALASASTKFNGKAVTTMETCDYRRTSADKDVRSSKDLGPLCR